MTVLNNVYHFTFFWQKQESTLFQSRSVASSTQRNALVARAILRFFFFLLLFYLLPMVINILKMCHLPLHYVRVRSYNQPFQKLTYANGLLNHSYFVLMCSLGPTSIKDYLSLITYLHSTPLPLFPTLTN